MRVSSIALATSLACLLLVDASARASGFTVFETGQVRPLALSPGGTLLYAANTPAGRLEVFRVGPAGLTPVGSVAVGLEPVAVAARSEHEVWVVNHLSDSVSVVRVGPGGFGPHVVRTLLVGDEPRDLVFAGPGRRRAFITTAHRGQNDPRDPQLTTPGVGRADVWVFDAAALGASLGGDPLAVISLFGDTPRALAVSPDGRRVYAAVFASGNRTTTLTEGLVPDGGEEAGGLPGPRTDHNGAPQPETGLIVKFDGAHWVDGLGRAWDDAVRFDLPDLDVFVLDAMATPPREIASYAGVGTTLFNLAVNPASGKVYVSNTEAQNHVRFEGPGVFGGSTVRGHLAESRITVLDGAAVLPRHLNKHIDYATCCAPIPNDENARSLAFPLDMAVTSDGETLYVAALGSSKVGVLDTAELEADSFVPRTEAHIALSGGGPTGLALDEARGRLYVLTRFDNAIAIVDTASRREIGKRSMFNPEPPAVVAGRRFLYDAAHTSSHGDSACASCHVFGDTDHLAWDLGDPDGGTLANPGPFRDPTFIPIDPSFRALKGPMVTQSLRGMANHGPMHWRGDRTGGHDEPSVQPDGGSFDEALAFQKFNVAFPGLVGRHAPLPPEEMQAFTDFILEVMYPPNPIRNLDNSLTAAEEAGRQQFFGPQADFVSSCAGCHTTDPDGNPGASRPGFFGTQGLYAFDNESQIFKIPHLRNLYQKVGMFGMPHVRLGAFPFPGAAEVLPGNNEHLGPQIRGFGFLHDGSFDTIFRFVSITDFVQSPFVPTAPPPGPEGDVIRRNLEAFLLAFPSNLAPIVGQQATHVAGAGADVRQRLDLLEERAAPASAS